MKQINQNIENYSTTEQIDNKNKKMKALRLRGIISFVLAFALLLSGTVAYFTDYATTQSTGTAGTVQISVDDNINLLNADGQDILNPGDIRPVQLKVKNEGNKSVDTEVVITLTSSIPMLNRMDATGNGSISLDDDLLEPIVLAQGEANEYQYNPDAGPYSSEFDLYWAKDIVAVEGYGYYPRATTDDEMVYPVMQRYINGVHNQIVYIIDGTVLSGNASLDEREKEYKQVIDLSQYIFYPDYVMYGGYYENSDYEGAGPGVTASVPLWIFAEEGIDTNGKTVIIPDTIEYYDDMDNTVVGPIEYISINPSDDVKAISVSKNVKGFLYEDPDADEDNWACFFTDAELEERFGIKVYRYNNLAGFTDPTFAPTISEEAYNQLSEDEKSDYILADDIITYDMVLLFDPHSDNRFQNASVSLQVEVRAKQHRNTESGWELVSESLAASIDTSVFKVENDSMRRVTLTGVQDGVDLNSLTDIVIPEGVQTIPNSFFEGLENLKTVTLPSTIEEIGAYAFSDCDNLTTINLPEGLEYIGDCAFAGCGSLDNIVFPSTLITVKSSAFRYSGLKEIVIPSTLDNIGESAFSESGLERVEFAEGCTTVPYSAFVSCNNLTTVIIPDSVTLIEYNAFTDCEALTDITIGSGVTEIYYKGFYVYGNTNIIDTTVRTNNEYILNYDWLNTEHRNVTFLPID